MWNCVKFGDVTFYIHDTQLDKKFAKTFLATVRTGSLHRPLGIEVELLQCLGQSHIYPSEDNRR